MEVLRQKIPDVWELVPEVHLDSRGSLVKTLNRQRYAELGLNWCFAEEYYSTSRRGVLRGLHFQVPPHDHIKLVYCIEGEVLDAVVDLRRGSPAFGRHALYKLSADNRTILYIPRGLAHGFFVRTATATMVYKTETVFAPSHDAGIRWNSAGIDWPDLDPLVSARDGALPMLSEFSSPFEYRG